MRIEKIHIENFGKLEDYTLELEKGFQIIYGANEDGKSTLMAFVELMFYGKQTRRANLHESPRERYLPWNGAAMSGSIQFCLNGESFQLQKIFGDIPSRDQIQLYNMRTGEEVKLPEGEVGETLFGMDLESYRRSAFMEKPGRIQASAKGAPDAVAEKLLQTRTDTGGDDLFGQEAVKRLEKERARLQPPRSDRGALPIARAQLSRLREEESQLQQREREQAEISEEYQKVQIREKELRVEKETLEKRLALQKELEKQKELSNLLQLAKLAEEQQEKLDKKGVPVANLPAYIEDGDQLHKQWERAEQAWQLIGGREDARAAELSEEQLECLRQMELTLLQSTQWLDEYSRTVPQQSEECKRLDREYAQRVTEQESQGKELEWMEAAYKKQWQKLNQKKKELESERKTQETRLSYSRERWEISQSRQETPVQAAGRRQRQKKKTTKPRWTAILLVVFTAIAVVGILIPLPMLSWVAIALAALSGLLHALLSYRTKTEKWSEQAAAEERTAASMQEEEEQKIRLEIHRIEEQRQQVAGELAAMQPKIEKWEGLRRRMQEGWAENQLLRKESVAARNKMKELEQGLLVKAKKWQPSGEPAATLSEAYQQTEDAQKHAASTAQKMLELDRAPVAEDFAKAYLSHEEEQRQKTNQTERKEQLREAAQSYINHAKRYDSVETMAEAEQVIEKCRSHLQSLQEAKREVSVRAEYLHVQDASTAAIERQIERLGERVEVPMLEEEDIDHMTKQRNMLDEQREHVQKQIHQLAASLHYGNRNIEQVRREIRDAEEQVQRLEKNYEAVCLALEMMRQAQEKMRQSFGMDVNQRTGQIATELTGQQYSQVIVDQNYDLMFQQEAHIKEAEYLSSGAYSQLYLALRFALMEQMSQSGDRITVWMDDVLLEYDDDRLHMTLSFLKDYAEKENMQILLMTAHGRMITLANELYIYSRYLHEAHG